MKKILPLILILGIYSPLFAQFWYPNQISTDNGFFSTGYPDLLVPSDLDNDGDLDLILNGTTINWMENLDGQGEYGNPELILNDNNNTFWMRVASFNIDGRDGNDVLIAKGTDIYWHQNTLRPSGIVERFDLPSLPSSAQQVGGGDLNGDGISDIICETLSDGLMWLEGIDGNGNFNDWQVMDDDLRDFIVIDIDDDGDDEVIGIKFQNVALVDFENSNNSFTTNFVIPINGGGSFGDISIIDISGEGKLDIVAAQNQTTSIQFVEQLEVPGTFSSNQFFSQGILYERPLITDIENDGDFDLIYRDFNKVMIAENIDGQGHLESREVFTLYAKPDEVLLVDVNNDGFQDILVAAAGSQGTKGQTLVFRSKGDGSFHNPVDFTSDEDNVHMMLSEDLNNDGTPELIMGHGVYARVTWQEFDNSSRKFKRQTLLPITDSDGAYTHIEIADLN